MKVAYVLLVSVLLAGCSNQQLYNAVQDSQKVDCQKYPDTRYEKCMEEFSVPYEEYESDRRGLENE